MWVVGDSHVYWAAIHALEREGPQLGLGNHGICLTWKGRRGATLCTAKTSLQELLQQTPFGPPDIIIFHLGTNDLIDHTTLDFHHMLLDLIDFCRATIPYTQLIWTSILPRPFYFGAYRQAGMNSKRQQINRNARSLFWRAGGKSIEFSDIDPHNFSLFRFDCLHLSSLGLDIFLNSLRAALEFFTLFPAAIRFPHVANLN